MDASPKYFSGMAESTREVRPILISIYAHIAERAPSVADELNMYRIPRCIGARHLLRPHLVRLVYETLGGTTWKKIVPFMAIAEMLNLSTYHVNSALDRKLTSTSEDASSRQMIAGMLVYDAIAEVIRSADLDPSAETEVFRALHKASFFIYQGQSLDIADLRISNSIYFSDRALFDQVYLQRCKYLGASLIDFCMTLGMLAFGIEKIPISAQAALHSIAECFGTGGQILNDLGDLSKRPKPYSSRMQDLRNGRLTLPIMLVLETAPPLQRKLFINKFSDDQAILFLKLFLDRRSEIIDTLTRDLWKYYDKCCIESESLNMLGYNSSPIGAVTKLLVLSKYLNKYNF